MGFPAEKTRYTVAEYLELEAKSPTKNEFHDGEILAMAGGTFQSSRIAMNLAALLVTRLRGSKCAPLDDNMRVRIGNRPDYVYPDQSIVCGEPIFDADDTNQTTILNPSVVIEILSPSTEAYDRGEKFELYRQIESFREYVLVSQKGPSVETYFRQDDGSWRIGNAQGLDAVAKLASVGIGLPLAQIYEGVTFRP